MDFSRLPQGVFENILARIDDVPELVGLRAVNRYFRRTLFSSEFTRAFNDRDRHAQSWLMTQVFDEHNIDYGILLGIEQTDAENRRTFRIPLHEIVEEVEVQSILLLAASGSLVLFKCVAEEDESTLIVLNLYSMEVEEISGLDGFRVDFDTLEHLTFRDVPNIDGMAFEISNVDIVDLVPRYSEFSNTWYMQPAQPLEDGENLIDFDKYHGMVLVFEDGVVYKVSSQWGDVVFTRANFLDLVLPAFHDAQREHFVEPDMGWNSVPGTHFGKDGYAILFQTHTHTSNGELLSRLKAICLFKLASNWNSYEHIATVPVDMILSNLHATIRGVYIEQTNNIVDIIFFARGYHDHFMLQYQYNLTTEEWGSHFTSLHDYDHVYRVVVTPSLTVGRTWV